MTALGDLPPLIAAHGPVVRVLVAEARGSTPRGPGAAMALWDGGQSGSIGGGRLEWEAARLSKEIAAPSVTRRPLGPALRQCCGGAVTLVAERWDADAIARAAAGGATCARPVAPGAAGMPEGIRRNLAKIDAPVLLDGWLAEPFHGRKSVVMIHGAGHVGLALAAILAPLPGLRVILADTRADRLRDPPPGVAPLPVAEAAAALAAAPRDATHYVMTHDHDADLSLCHALLSSGALDIGLIGSKTKSARFRSRLAALGHDARAIARVRCPIGDPAFGKHPQAIAVSIAAERLSPAGPRPEETA